LILANDVLLKVATDDNDSQENTVTHMINGDAYSITYTQESPVEVAETEENVEVIQLLNIDGTITTIDKNALNTLNGKEKTNNFENFFTQVEAYKCKFCSFLCESVEEITTHISLEHAKEVYGTGIMGCNLLIIAGAAKQSQR
jgi:rubrerythrin